MQVLHNIHNLFDLPHEHNNTEAVCITTNGIVRTDGKAVMGRGIAKYADEHFNLSKKLADYLILTGNHAYDLGIYEKFHIISFPTKQDWRKKSDIKLIIQSCHEVIKIADDLELQTIYLPAPGCGNGQLRYQDVEPVISKILDDRFIVGLPY